MERYIEESRGLHPTSPASTAPEVYQIFEADAPLAVRIRESKAHVPTHYQAVDEEDRGKLLDFDVPLQDFVEVPLQVQTVFPPREPEAAPQAFSYYEKGAKEGVSFLSRTSLPPGSATTGPSRLRSGYVPTKSISGAFRGRTRSKGKDRIVFFIPDEPVTQTVKATGYERLQGNEEWSQYQEYIPIQAAPDVTTGNFLHGIVSANLQSQAPPAQPPRTTSEEVVRPPVYDVMTPGAAAWTTPGILSPQATLTARVFREAQVAS